MAEAIVYGGPPPGLVEVPAGARQVSPLIPGSGVLEDIADATVDAAVVVAPPGTLERAFVLAHAVRALKPGSPLTVLAPKDKGGTRLRKGLEAFGCAVEDEARRHYRICRARRPAAPAGLEAAIAAGAPRFLKTLALWSQPGVFAWDRIDPGSALLLTNLPPLAGQVADFGCGVGVLAQGVLAAPAVSHLTLIDLDRRAIDCARRNVVDPRAEIVWADVRRLPAPLEGLDAVVMNPPFHDGGREDRDLGAGFIAAAARALRKGGRCWLVANRHLPYEAPLKAAFAAAVLKAEAGGYKLYEARK